MAGNVFKKSLSATSFGVLALIVKRCAVMTLETDTATACLTLRSPALPVRNRPIVVLVVLSFPQESITQNVFFNLFRPIIVSDLFFRASHYIANVLIETERASKSLQIIFNFFLPLFQTKVCKVRKRL